jgi:hypothetical protein
LASFGGEKSALVGKKQKSNSKKKASNSLTFLMINIERHPFKSKTFKKLAMSPSPTLIYLIYLAFMSLTFGAGGLRVCAELLIQLSVSIVLVVSSSTMLLQTLAAASISFPTLLYLAVMSLAFFAGLCEELLPVLIAVPIEMARSIAKFAIWTLRFVRSSTMKLQAIAAASFSLLLLHIDTVGVFLAVQFMSIAGLCVELRSVLASCNRIFLLVCSSTMLMQATAAVSIGVIFPDIDLVCFSLAIIAVGVLQFHGGKFVLVAFKRVSYILSCFVLQVSICMLQNPVIHGVECPPAPESVPEDDSSPPTRPSVCWNPSGNLGYEDGP